MNRRTTLALATTALLCSGFTFSAGQALAQQKSLKEQLTGAWISVSADSTAPDGKKQQLFGPNPKGILVFEASGQYVQLIVNPDTPKFKSNNRLTGTAEENAATVRGTTATFGTWTVDEASKTITTRYVGSLLPNQAGTENKRTVVSVSADELKLSTPTTGSGMRADNVFRRAK